MKPSRSTRVQDKTCFAGDDLISYFVYLDETNNPKLGDKPLWWFHLHTVQCLFFCIEMEKMEFQPLFLTLRNTEKSEIRTRKKKEAKYGKSISTNIDFHENLFRDSDSAHFFKLDC